MNDPETLIYEVERGRARITLNRPEKLNALSQQLQVELNDALWEADNDNNVHAVIIRGNGRAFSAGYDLTPMASRRPTPEGEHYTAVYRGGRSFDDDAWQMERSQRLRMAIFDMHKPVIAQVHGYCLAGGTELATACDIVYVADDAQIGYPPVRLMSPPDMQYHPWLLGMRRAMELMLTGDAMSGREAAEWGFATRSFPLAELDQRTLDFAERAAKVPVELQQLNKRSVHRAMEIMGARAAMRAGTEIQALAFTTEASRNYLSTFRRDGSSVRSQLDQRDTTFGDYRTRKD